MLQRLVCIADFLKWSVKSTLKTTSKCSCMIHLNEITCNFPLSYIKLTCNDMPSSLTATESSVLSKKKWSEPNCSNDNCEHKKIILCAQEKKSPFTFFRYSVTLQSFIELSLLIKLKWFLWVMIPISEIFFLFCFTKCVTFSIGWNWLLKYSHHGIMDRMVMCVLCHMQFTCSRHTALFIFPQTLLK